MAEDKNKTKKMSGVLKQQSSETWIDAALEAETGSSVEAGSAAKFEEVAKAMLAQEPQLPPEQKWLLHHAASHMINGYKETWWASIRAMADTMRLGEEATESQCKSLFLRWGAKLK